MRAIMIDDEPLLLNYQKTIIEKVEGFHLVGAYTSPAAAMREITQTKPEIVFLDIELMGENGLKAADQLLEQYPSLHVVFITGHSQYAVEAFEVQAIDYILKPLTQARLAKTYDRLTGGKNRETQAVKCASIESCDTLQFSDEHGHPIEVKWRTSKAKELFLFLLHHRGKSVSKDRILNHLWPEGSGKKVYNQLYTTVYQIRNTLATHHIEIEIASKEDNYILYLHDVALDVDRFEHELESYGEISEANVAAYQQTMQLYKGDYLEASAYDWAEAERERLRQIWQLHMKKLVDYFTSRELYEKAILAVQNLQQQNPYQEDSYFSLMKLHHQLGDRIQVEEQYAKLQEMLAEQLGIKPERAVQKWYDKWKAGFK